MYSEVSELASSIDLSRIDEHQLHPRRAALRTAAAALALEDGHGARAERARALEDGAEPLLRARAGGAVGRRRRCQLRVAPGRERGGGGVEEAERRQQRGEAHDGGPIGGGDRALELDAHLRAQLGVDTAQVLPPR